jgi:hypothetical protein
VLKENTQTLKPGVTRHEVESYLQLNSPFLERMCCIMTKEASDIWSELVKIGKEEAPLHCDRHSVYVAFEFRKASDSFYPRVGDGDSATA